MAINTSDSARYQAQCAVSSSGYCSDDDDVHLKYAIDCFNEHVSLFVGFLQALMGKRGGLFFLMAVNLHILEMSGVALLSC